MPRRADPDPAGLPRVVTHAEALAAGLSNDQVRQRVRSGRWERLARGVYRRSLPQEPIGRDEPIGRGEPTQLRTSTNRHQIARQDHRDRAIAAALVRPGAVIAGHSAAVLHDLPLISPIPEQPHLVRSGGRIGARDGVIVRTANLTDAEVVDLGAPVTSPIRTWTDIARTGHLPDALACGDAALRRGLLVYDELLSVAQHVTGRGARMVRLGAGMLDARRETALESWSVACFHEWGLPMPVPQVGLVDGLGRFVARVDFMWTRWRVIGEADGALKYADRSVLVAEKRREDRLRELGFTVIRWGWGDLARGDVLRRRLERALAAQ